MIEPAREAGHLEYRPDIDGLRAIAVLAVVAFHSFPNFLPGGFIGVDVFFVISGYLISRIVLNELERAHFRLANFYARRARRILPALLLVLVTAGIIGWLLLPPIEYTSLGKSMATGAAFVANFSSWGEPGYWGHRGYFDTSSQLKPLLHLWSLGVEEQFYLFWPLALTAAWKRQRLVLLFISVMSLSFALNLWGTFHKPVVNFYFPLSRFWELLVGGALAYKTGATGCRRINDDSVQNTIMVDPIRGFLPFGRSRGVTRELCAIFGLVIVIGTAIGLNKDRDFPGAWAVLPTAGAMLLILAGSQTLINRRLLSNPLLVGIGLISYPLYLWHWPLLAFASVLALRSGSPTIWKLTAVVSAFILAWGTYVLIERKTVRVFKRAAGTLTVGLIGGLAALAFVGIGIIAAGGFPSRSPLSATLNSFVSAPHEVAMRRGVCFIFPEDGLNEPVVFEQNHCASHDDSGRPLIMLVGDSHAAHLYPGLQAAFGHQVNIGQLTSGGCIPLITRLNFSRSLDATPRCRRINEYVIDEIKALRPAVLIVGAYFVRYDSLRELAYPNFLDLFSQSLNDLAAFGVQTIIVVGEVPTWSPSLPQIVDYSLVRGETLPKYASRGLDQSAFEIEGRLRTRVWGPHVHYLSMIEQLCASHGCLTTVGPSFPNDLIAFDYGHLSASGSAYVATHILSDAIVEGLSSSGVNADEHFETNY